MNNKNSYQALVGGIILFFVAFLISRAHFFYCPVVGISNDTGVYVYWFDEFLSKGELPPVNYIPIGYPLIIKILTTLKDSLYTIVYFQFFITFITFASLLAVVWRFYNKAIYFLTLFLVIVYVQVPNSVFYDINILSESLYNSSLVLLMAALIWFVNNPHKTSALFLSFVLAIPALFRPVGVFAIVIFLLIFLYLIIKKRSLVLPFTFPLFLVFLVISIYSEAVSDNFFFVLRRANPEFGVSGNKNTQATDLAVRVIKTSIQQEKFEKAIIQYSNYTNQSQLYTKADEILERYFDRKYPYTNEWLCCDVFNIDSTKIFERKRIFKEFYDLNAMSFLRDKETQFKKTTFFKLYDLFQLYFIKKFILKPVWIILMFVAFVAGAIVFFTSKFTNKAAILLLLIIAINIGTMAILIIASHDPYPRYSYPSEFIFLLQLPFFIALISDRKNAQQ